jgi:MFS superfamily sulfate permease-like transporter
VGGRISRAARFAPGLTRLLGYRREWLQYDLVAGLSVAAVAVPIALAYARKSRLLVLAVAGRICVSISYRRYRVWNPRR